VKDPVTAEMPNICGLIIYGAIYSHV